MLLTITGALLFAGAQWPPRRVRALLALLVGLALGGIVIAGGLASDNPIYGVLRAAGYALVGLLVAIAASGRDDDAGSTAAALVPLIVAVGEGSDRGLVHLLMVLQSDHTPPERWAAAVERMSQLVAPQWTASLVALGLASLFAVSGLAKAPRRIDRFVAVGLAVAIAWGVLLGAGAGESRIAAMSVSSPSASD